MIGKPVIAEEWNALLHTTKGGKVVALLAPFHTTPLTLQPQLPELNAIATKALAGIGKRCSGITVVARNQQEEFFDGSPCDRGFYESGLQPEREFGNEEDINLFDVVPAIEESLLLPLMCKVKKLITVRNINDRNDFIKNITLNLLVLFEYRVLYTAKGNAAGMKKIEPFLQLLLAGNLPVGITGSGTFLVLVA